MNARNEFQEVEIIELHSIQPLFFSISPFSLGHFISSFSLCLYRVSGLDLELSLHSHWHRLVQRAHIGRRKRGRVHTAHLRRHLTDVSVLVLNQRLRARDLASAAAAASNGMPHGPQMA